MKLLKKLLFIFIILIIVTASVGFLIGFSIYSKTLKEKPLFERIDEITSNENFIKFNDLSDNYIDAVIATEDHRFYEHGPVDFIAIARALYTNIRDGKFDEGGSTISQQVAKNVLFSQEKSVTRKLAEIFGAYDLEKYYSKNEILELYVNTSYFGDGYYGIYNASMGYYNKLPKDLTLDEATILAGVPNAPSIYAPTVNMDLCKKRQSHVLNKMIEYGYISQEEVNKIK